MAVVDGLAGWFFATSSHILCFSPSMFVFSALADALAWSFCSFVSLFLKMFGKVLQTTLFSQELSFSFMQLCFMQFLCCKRDAFFQSALHFASSHSFAPPTLLISHMLPFLGMPSFLALFSSAMWYLSAHGLHTIQHGLSWSLCWHISLDRLDYHFSISHGCASLWRMGCTCSQALQVAFFFVFSIWPFYTFVAGRLSMMRSRRCQRWRSILRVQTTRRCTWAFGCVGRCWQYHVAYVWLLGWVSWTTCMGTISLRLLAPNHNYWLLHLNWPIGKEIPQANGCKMICQPYAGICSWQSSPCWRHGPSPRGKHA